MNDYLEVDANYKMSLGTVQDKVDTTILGCVNLMLETIVNKYPNTPIAIVTSPASGTAYGNMSAANTSEYKAHELFNGIKDCAHNFGIPVLDLYNEGGIRYYNTDWQQNYGWEKAEGVTDLLHFNIKAHAEILAPRVRKFLESIIV